MKNQNFMKTHLTSIILGLLIFGLSHTVSAQFGGGTGTAGDPYLISTPAHLNAIRGALYLPKYYRQTANIDLNVSPYNTGDGWNPIGDDSDGNRFTGNYNGNGFTISGLTINRPTEGEVGLFGCIGLGTAANPVVIRKVVLISVGNVTGARGTGSLVGRVRGNVYTLIENCSTSGNGTVSGNGATGGLVGANNSARETPGGTDNPTLSQSWANIAVLAVTGGGGDKIGGLVGCNQKGNTINCYARGSVTTPASGTFERVGGLAGCTDLRGTIINSFSTGLVTKGSNTVTRVGGLVGYLGTGGNRGVVTDSYWDKTTSGQTTSAAGTGYTNAEMKVQANFTGFDFTLVWNIDGTTNDGYPYLLNTGVTTYNYWTGANGTTWTNTGNWSAGRLPIATDIAVIPSNLTNYPIITSTEDITATAKILDILTTNPSSTSDGKITINPLGKFTVVGDLRSETTGILIESDASGTGSLIQDAERVYATVQRYLTEGIWHYISAPVNDTRVFNVFLGLTAGVNNDQFYWWDEDGVDNGSVGIWFDILNTPTGISYTLNSFVSSQGYAISYSGTENTAISFEGTLYTSDQSISLTKTDGSTNEGSNMVGNPFCSTIALNSAAAATDNFITQNTAALDDNYEAVYLWDEGNDWVYPRNSDYITISNSTEEATYAAPGQAFMVQAASDISLSFNTSIRKHGTATFYKNSNANERKGLVLLVNNSENLSNSTEVLFMSGMTKGLDPSYDAGKMKGNPNIALYTRLLEDNGVDFAIQALPTEGITEFVIPVGVDVAEAREFSFSATQENLDNYNIILEDRQENTFTDLSQEDYSATISESGTGRFYLHFKDATAIDEITNETKITFRVMDGKILIQNPEEESGTMSLINSTGQMLDEQQLYGSNQVLNANYAKGVYLIAIQTEKATVSKKVFIK